MFITRCDRCGAEREGKPTGWAKVSVYTRANRDDRHLDVCPACVAEMLASVGLQRERSEEATT